MSKESRSGDMGKFADFLSLTLNQAIESQTNCIVWNTMAIEPFKAKIGHDLSLMESWKRQGEEVKKMEERGVEMLNNFPLASKSYLFDLYDSGEISMPYTEHPVLIGDETVEEKTKNFIEKLGAQNNKLPNLIVRKPNGIFGARTHGGHGVEVLDPQKTKFEWNDIDLVFQEFVYPPLSIFKDGYLRDFRVMVIGGEAKMWYARRAKDRLINPETGELEENPPSSSRFLSNLCREGQYEEPPKELKKAAFQFAEKVHQVITKWGNGFREQIWQIGGEAKCRFMSVDLLFDQECNPKLLEVDFFPDMRRFPKNDVLVEKTASYLKNLAGRTGKMILINNFFGDYELANQTTCKLVNQNINCKQMVLPREESSMF